MKPSVSRVLGRYLKTGSGMKVVHALQEFPETWSKSIFLAGPTPRADNPVPSWRGEALDILRSLGFDGVVFVPEPEDLTWSTDYEGQVQWETRGMNLADVIVFWVPRDLKTMPAFTTNVEFGRWVDSHKIVLGHPPEAPKNRYLDSLLDEVSEGKQEPCSDLQTTLEEALAKIGEGALRTGGERCVPLYIWRTPMFQSWYQCLQEAGNRLDDAKVRWVFYLPSADKIFSWVLWVKVYIAAEDRWKDNEWVFSRTDISTVVLYHRMPNLLDSEIVLVREFRSPARTADGFIYELPGGSSTAKKSPEQVARDEVKEETGLRIASSKARQVANLRVASSRFKMIGSRQVAGTLSSHHAMVFAVELSSSEISEAREAALSGEHHGVEEDTERTYVEVVTVRDCLNSDNVDWSNMGMILTALAQDNG